MLKTLPLIGIMFLIILIFNWSSYHLNISRLPLVIKFFQIKQSTMNNSDSKRDMNFNFL